MTNSRQKGKRGELATAKELNRLFPGANARRGQQFKGSPDSPDIAHDLDGVHFENKDTEKTPLWIYKQLDQAIADAGTDEVPVVIAKRNRKPRVAIVLLDDLPRLVSSLGIERMKG